MSGWERESKRMRCQTGRHFLGTEDLAWVSVLPRRRGNKRVSLYWCVGGESARTSLPHISQDYAGLEGEDNPE